MKKVFEKYPWISFEINLEKLPAQTWFVLGECVSKCRHIRQIPLLPDVRDELHRIYLCKGVHATTAIEGNTLSEQQVRQILDGSATAPESKKYLKQEVENILTACNRIAAQLHNGQAVVWTPDLLCRYNQWVLAGDIPVADGAIPGKIRSDVRGVGSYRAPAPSDVPELLAHFCRWFGSLGNPDNRLNALAFEIVRAIAAHLYIELIHPFGDGNGRTGRLVEFTILLAGGIPSPAAQLLSNHYNATRTEYYRQLDRISKTGGDLTNFFDYAIQGLHDGLQEIIDYIVVQTQLISWEHFIYDEFRKLPAKEMFKRQRDVLIAISRQQKKMTRQEIQEVTAKIYLETHKKANSQTRDLNDLVKNGWLIATEDRYSPAVDRILQRRPFSVQ